MRPVGPFPSPLLLRMRIENLRNHYEKDFEPPHNTLRKLGFDLLFRTQDAIKSSSTETAASHPMSQHHIIANGNETPAIFPCSIEEFLRAQSLLPRSVVVEHNGEAVAPSEFSRRPLAPGDRLEIIRIVAGG